MIFIGIIVHLDSWQKNLKYLSIFKIFFINIFRTKGYTTTSEVTKISDLAELDIIISWNRKINQNN